jgi:hypothetical protein
MAFIPNTRIPDGPRSVGARMNSGEVLHLNEFIESSNGAFRLVMQADGNLVLYAGAGTVAMWSSGTMGKGAMACLMQTDGNLVLYNAACMPVWATGTNGNPNAGLEMQNDGNLVLYRADRGVLFSSGTSRHVGNSTLVFRGRMKRWTDVPFFGTKGDDTILVKIPPGARLKCVTIAPISYSRLDPSVNSSIHSEVGDASSGARLNSVSVAPDGVAIGVHWWFDAFRASYYSISVWVEGPNVYPIEDDNRLNSANVNAQILNTAGQWFINHQADLAIAAGAIVALCVDVATLGTATPVTTAVLIAAISAAATAGTKIALSGSH